MLDVGVYATAGEHIYIPIETAHDMMSCYIGT